MFIEIFLFSLAYILYYEYYLHKRPKNYPPGPVGLPLLGYLVSLAPDPHVKIGRLGKKYGKIFSVKFGSYWFVVLNDFETIKLALKNDAFNARPSHLLLMEQMKKGIIFSSGSAWQEQRRFSLKALRDFGFGKISLEASIQEEVANLTGHLQKKMNIPIELKELFAISFLNGLWHIVAGEKFSLDDPLPRKVYQAAKEGFMEPKVQGPMYFLPWIARIFPDLSGLTKVRVAVQNLKDMLGKVIEEHQLSFAPGTKPRDFIDVYLQEMDDKRNDPSSTFYKTEGVENLVDVLMNLFVAGSDTLSCTLGFAILYLVSHQNVIAKVQEEIDRVIGKNRMPDNSDRPKLPYTEAVIHETYRLSSIVPGSIMHAVSEDIELLGFTLPKGTIVLPNLWEVHRDPVYWEEPEEFKPERFINADGSFRKDDHVIPFSVGKRSCMAENMAQSQFFLFLTGILQKFNVTSAPDYPLPDISAKSAGVLSPLPYKVILSARQ